MRTAITGAAGFIGSHVAELLIADGHEVLAIDDLSGGFLENLPAGAEFEKLSVLDPLDEVFSSFRPEVVYHLAAYAAEGLSHHLPVFNFTNNVVATANVLAAGYRAGVKHFVFTSSIAAYGHPEDDTPFDEESVCNPCDPYGAAKLACEHHIRSFAAYFGKPDFTIFRPHNVFGPRQNISDPYRNVVGIFMRCALTGQPLPIFGDGTQTRSFSYITSVARSIADAPATGAALNRTFNVGGDELMSVRDLAGNTAKVMGVPLSIEWLPPRAEVTHAHCRHELAQKVFSSAHEESIDIVSGLTKMAAFVKARPIPPATECPAVIEISDRMPPSWATRLDLKLPGPG
jgi:UDP-glucose 4-epimerase